MLYLREHNATSSHRDRIMGARKIMTPATSDGRLEIKFPNASRGSQKQAMATHVSKASVVRQLNTRLRKQPRTGRPGRVNLRNLAQRNDRRQRCAALTADDHSLTLWRQHVNSNHALTCPSPRECEYPDTSLGSGHAPFTWSADMRAVSARFEVAHFARALRLVVSFAARLVWSAESTIRRARSTTYVNVVYSKVSWSITG